MSDDVQVSNPDPDYSLDEHQWRNGDEYPEALANFALRLAGDRKVRLFMVACGGLLPAPLVSERLARAFALAALHADGLAAVDEVRAVHEALVSETFCHANDAQDLETFRPSGWLPETMLAVNATSLKRLTVDPDPLEGDGWTSFCADGSPTDFAIEHLLMTHGDRGALLRPRISAIVRDLVGDPFHPVAARDAWRTPSVRELAQAMDRERDPGRMPLLADALVAAGCDEPRLLEHCREAVHVQGCWLLDLLMDRR